MTALADILETYTGKSLSLENPQADQIDIRDIARGLSLACRFAGQTRRPYSVAQHSVAVSQMMVPPGLRLPALLHDAHEAWLADVPAPVKASLLNYKTLSDRIDRAVAERFGFDVELLHHPDVKAADARAARLEAQALLQSGGAAIGWKALERPRPRLVCWSPDAAQGKFLSTAKALMR